MYARLQIVNKKTREEIRKFVERKLYYSVQQTIKNYDSPSYNFSWKRVRLAGIASAACLQLGLGQ